MRIISTALNTRKIHLTLFRNTSPINIDREIIVRLFRNTSPINTDREILVRENKKNASFPVSYNTTAMQIQFPFSSSI